MDIQDSIPSPVHGSPLGRESINTKGMYQKYKFRWFILFLFILTGAANSLVLLTWSPIFNSARQYFSCGLGSNTATGVNLLTVSFQIMFVPGTLYAIKTVGGSNIRRAVINGSILTGLGTVIRWYASQSFKDKNNDAMDHATATCTSNYLLILLGTLIVAFAQPIFLNLPTLVALVWFPVNQRDLAMTLLGLGNTIGSAMGTIIAPLFVKSEHYGHKGLNEAVNYLLMTQFIVAAVVMTFVSVFFSNAPPTPPSRAAEKLNQEGAGRGLLESLNEDGDEGREDLIDGRVPLLVNGHDDGNNPLSPSTEPIDNGNDDSNVQTRASTRPKRGSVMDAVIKPETYQYLSLLFNDKQYVKLLIALSFSLGNLNALASLLGQLPHQLEGQQIGFMGFVLIISGFVGAVICGGLLAKTHKYSIIMKVCYCCALISWFSFMLNCHGKNLIGILISIGFTGMFMLAIIPSVLQNAVECTYPIPEDITVGLLYIGANTMAIPFTFIGQYLLDSDAKNTSEKMDDVVRFTPYGIFTTSLLLIATLLVLSFKADYRRLNLDLPTDV